MGVKSSSKHRKGLSNLTDEQQMLLFVMLGVLGLILGFLFDVIAGIGMIMIWSALILSVPAWRDHDSDWSKEVLAQCYALATFGGMASIGFALRLFAEVLT